MSDSLCHGGVLETTFTHIHGLAQLPFAITLWRLLPSLSTIFRAFTVKLLNFPGFLTAVSLIVDIAVGGSSSSIMMYSFHRRVRHYSRCPRCRVQSHRHLFLH